MSTTLTDRKQRLDSESIRTDKLQVGPRGTVLGDAWQTWTPTYSTGAPNAASVIGARYTVVGRLCTFKFTLRQSAAGTQGSGNYLVSLPPGLTAVVGSVSEAIGSATLQVASASHIGTVMVQPGATSFGVFVTNDTVAPAFWSSSLGPLNGTDLTLTATATFEIAN